MTIIYIIIAVLVGFTIGLSIKFFRVKQLNQERLRKYYYEIEQLDEHIERKKNDLHETDKQILNRLSQLNETIEQEASAVHSAIEREKERSYEAFSAYIDTLEFAYQENEEEFDRKINELKTELNKLKSARTAVMEAALREQQLKEEIDFYKIKLSSGDLEDIKILEEIKPRLRKPEILSKLIWTTYYQKPLTTLCNNVLGEKMVCGIYKITDLETGLIYIGQSVNIAQRWKDHVKSALGAGTTASDNKLYRAMRTNGVHNFSFELLEVAPPENLNEAEKRYIEFYQSNTYGLNTIRGTK